MASERAVQWESWEGYANYLRARLARLAGAQEHSDDDAEIRAAWLEAEKALEEEPPDVSEKALDDIDRADKYALRERAERAEREYQWERYYSRRLEQALLQSREPGRIIGPL